MIRKMPQVSVLISGAYDSVPFIVVTVELDEILKRAASIVRKEIDCKYRLFLFGSRAKGDFHERSDIDIGILAEREISPLQIMTVQEKLEQIPTLLKIDFVDFNSLENDFKKAALKHTQDINK